MKILGSINPVTGFVGGFLLGPIDVLTFRLLGVSMMLGSTDVTIWVCLFFGLSFGLLGFLIGKLNQTSAELRVSAETVERQVRELEDTRAQVIQNEKLAALGRLAAGVAHEVRNPLGVIRSSATMLEEGFDDEAERVEVTSFIRDEVDRLNRFVTVLLDFSRPTTPERRLVELTRLVRDLQTRAEPLCSELGVTLRLDESAEDDAELDPDLVGQALLTLVLNAAQSSPGGQVEVRVDSDEHRARFEIADDGPGVPDDIRDSLFEPFVTKKTDGTGLGLPMARRIAEAHGGTVELAESGGLGDNGCCFVLTIPRSAA